MSKSLLLVAALFSLAWAADVAPPAPDLAREARSVQAVCAKCHNLQIVMDTPMSYDAWHDTVQKMVDRGASGTDEQFEDIMDYLHRTMTTINVNAADADELEIVLNLPEAGGEGDHRAAQHAEIHRLGRLEVCGGSRCLNCGCESPVDLLQMNWLVRRKR